MINKTFKILFFLRKSKRKSGGSSPVFVRVTVNGERFELSTARVYDPAGWNKDVGRASGHKQEAKALNSFLDVYQSQIFEAQRELLSRGKDVTAKSLRDRILGVEEESKTLVEVYRYHIKQIEELVGKEYAVGTLKRFRSSLVALEAFIQWKFKRSDVSLRDLTHQFITEFEFYLKSVRGIQHNTAMGSIKKLKKIVRQCVANDWLDKDPFMSYKVKIRDTNRTYLTSEELNSIVTKKLSLERLAIARDIFVFSCYTGLAYSDVEKLTPSDIATGMDGEKWIFTTRTKTDTPTRVPLLPTAISILERYAKHVRVEIFGKALPVFSNQKLNGYLKEIADMCDVKKELTFHCARHTFATTVTLTNGVPIETVSKMLGHKNIRTTQIYAKIVDRKVSEDMMALRMKLPIPV